MGSSSDEWLEGHTFSQSRNGLHEKWSVPRLWEAATGLSVRLVAIADIPHILTESWVAHWADPDHPEVRLEASRTQEADLAYPVILHPKGHLMDGFHRVCKALQLGFTHVQAVQFTKDTLPAPDIAWQDEKKIP